MYCTYPGIADLHRGEGPPKLHNDFVVSAALAVDATPLFGRRTRTRTRTRNRTRTGILFRNISGSLT